MFKADGYSDGDLFAYQYNWTQSKAISAGGLAAYVRRVLATTGAHQVDIVNHSMGGLVSHWYVKRLGGPALRPSPRLHPGANHGTTAAGACLVNLSCVEMFPGSVFWPRSTQATKPRVTRCTPPDTRV